MRKNKFLAALAIAACLATSVPLSASAATPGQATDPTKVAYGTVTKTEEAVLADMYDDDFYKEQNPDLAAAGITTKEARFAHFIQRGVFEGRACNKDFNVSAYMAYEDLQKAFGTNVVAYYVHYNAFGKNEKRFTTVEGAVAAGKTVKSIDGKVVTAAAPKAAATSGSTTSKSDSKDTKAEEKKEDGGVKETKVTFPTLASVASGSTEVVLNLGVAYSYEGQKFYDTSSERPLESRPDENYVKASNGLYYTIENYVNGFDDETYAGKWTRQSGQGFYRGDNPLCPNDTDSNTEVESYYKIEPVASLAATPGAGGVKAGLNENWINGKRKDIHNFRYKAPKTVSGDWDWNLNSGYHYAVDDDRDGVDNAWFYKGSDATKINIAVKPFVRYDAETEKYYSVFANANGVLENNVEDTNIYRVGEGKNLQEASDAEWVVVTAKAGYFFVDGSGKKVANAKKAGTLVPVKEATMKDACKEDKVNFTKDGSTYVWVTVQVPERYGSSTTWYHYDNKKYGISGGYVYEAVEDKDALKEGWEYVGKYTYYDYESNTSDKYTKIKEVEDQVINTTVGGSTEKNCSSNHALLKDHNDKGTYIFENDYYHKTVEDKYAVNMTPGSRTYSSVGKALVKASDGQEWWRFYYIK